MPMIKPMWKEELADKIRKILLSRDDYKVRWKVVYTSDKSSAIIWANQKFVDIIEGEDNIQDDIHEVLNKTGIKRYTEEKVLNS